MSFKINIDNERKILSYIINNVSRIVEVDNLFISDVSKDIYAVLNVVYTRGVPCTVDMLKSNLHRLGKEIDKKDLVLIRDSYPDISDIYDAIDILKEDYVRNRVGKELLEDAYNKYYTNTDDGLDALIRAIDKIKTTSEDILSKEKEIWSSKDLAHMYKDVIETRAITLDYIKTTGCRHFDSMLAYPFHPKQITTVFGQKGSGKSSFVQYIVNRLIYVKTPVLYVPLELDREVSMDRFISMRTGLPMHKIVRNQLSDDEKARVEKARTVFESYDNFFLSDSEASVSQLERRIKNVQERTGNKYMVVVVDLGTQLKEFGDDIGAQNIESAMNKLHAMAGRTGVHIVFVVQENENRLRGAVKITKQNIRHLKPKLSDIKGGASIAERSRVVVYVWNQTYMEKVFASGGLSDKSAETELNPEVNIKPPDGALILDISVMKQNLGKFGAEIQYLYYPEICRLMPYIGEA